VSRQASGGRYESGPPSQLGAPRIAPSAGLEGSLRLSRNVGGVLNAPVKTDHREQMTSCQMPVVVEDITGSARPSPNVRARLRSSLAEHDDRSPAVDQDHGEKAAVSAPESGGSCGGVVYVWAREWSMKLGRTTTSRRACVRVDREERVPA